MTIAFQMTNSTATSGSFRDPNGFIFKEQGQLYRQVNLEYQENYDQLMSSGLYQDLIQKKLLIPHQEVDHAAPVPSLAYKILQPEMVGMISYPYEWSFSQLKDAALRTLTIQKIALKFGMTLKDASAYNIQFHQGRPIFIDTLSFETYHEGEPWVAYKQFCQHFLAPLALMANTDIRLGQLFRVFMDGAPLDLASRLLPASTRWNFGLATHLHLHASFQKKHGGKGEGSSGSKGGMSRNALNGLIESLAATVKKLSWKPAGTEWGDYYEKNTAHYSSAASRQKMDIVNRYLDGIMPGTVWDLGANTGLFSRLASERGIPTTAFDIDPAAVESNYLASKSKKETKILPLLLDLTNPSPAIGWAHRERMSFMERGPVDAVLALAVIHHLAISNNVSLSMLARFFHEISDWLVLEFVPKDDPQVQILLASRKDIFPQYTLQGFKQAFEHYFDLVEETPVQETSRTLFLLRARK